MDVLSPWLALMPVSGRVETRCHFGAPWHIAPGPAAQLEIPFHVLLEGTAVLEVPGRAPVALQPGDVVLLPHGDAHRLHDGSGQPPQGAMERASTVLTVAENLGDGPVADLLCGRFLLGAQSGPMVHQFLPTSLVVSSHRARRQSNKTDKVADTANTDDIYDTDHIDDTDDTDDAATRQRLAQLIGLMRLEAQEEGPGSEAVIGHLCGALFSLALRRASRQQGGDGGDGEGAKTLLALAHRTSLQPALMAMFSQPQKPWTLPELAALCHMSRATLIRHFETATGHSPAELLLQIRMARAMQRLLQSERSAAAIAEEVGYQSEAAFQRAFKRHLGITPARFRAAQGR